MTYPGTDRACNRLMPVVARRALLRFASCLVTVLLVAAHVAVAAPRHAAEPTTPAADARKRPAVETLEGRNKVLSAARLRQQLASTLDNERALAEEYATAGVLDAAMDHFSAALRIDQHDVPSLDGVARIWRDWGYANLGLPHAYRAVYWAPDSAPAQNTLGTLLLKLGVVGAARVRFERARALAPDAAYPLNNLCYLERQRANVPDAVNLCRDAAAIDPASHTVRNNLALALAAAGDLDAAFSALETGASPAVAAYNQGIVLLAARHIDRAREAFARARIADPTFLPALSRLKQLAALGAH